MYLLQSYIDSPCNILKSSSFSFKIKHDAEKFMQALKIWKRRELV